MNFQGAGKPILFVHGSQSDHRTWRQQMESFRKSHRVIAYSRRHHRPNLPIPDGVDYSMPQHVDDLEAIIGALGIAPVHLVGHSYGAFVSMILAMRRPDLIRRLVLAEPPVITLFVSNPPRPHELLGLFVTHPRLAAAILKFGATAIAPARAALQKGDRETAFQITGRAVLGPEAVRRLSPERLQQARDNLIPAELLGSGFPHLDPKQVRQLRPPVLFVNGTRTRPLFRLLTDALHEMIPGATRAKIPHASHLMHEDNAAAFNAGRPVVPDLPMRVSHATLALQRNLELRQRLKLRSRLGCDALHQRGRGYPMMPETVRHDGDPITQWNPGGPSAVLPHPHSLLSHEAST